MESAGFSGKLDVTSLKTVSLNMKQLLNVQRFRDAKEVEIHTAEPLVHEHGLFGFKLLLKT
jgi:hypothetical protein